METVIERLLTQADIILFDAPPVIVVTDAVVLATKLDGVLLVLSSGSTKRDMAKQAIDRLNKVNAPLLGSVLNNVALDSSLNSYYK